MADSLVPEVQHQAHPGYHFRQFHGHIKTSLPTRVGSKASGRSLRENSRYKLKCNWFNINLVRNLLVRHDGGRV